jgi:hypothetical protein
MQIERLGHFLKKQNKGKGITPFHLMKINQNESIFFFPLLALSNINVKRSINGGVIIFVPLYPIM